MNDLSPLTAEAQQLHDQLEVVKTQTSKEVVEQHLIIIDRFRNKIDAEQKALSRQIRRLQDAKGVLELIEGEQSTDKAELKNTMFKLIEEKKDAMFGRIDTPPPHHVHG